MNVWYSKSHPACQLPTEGGVGWAPGGDLLLSTSGDGGLTWSNATVSPCPTMLACSLSKLLP